ncbi:hypothetical protein [Streptomyces sp. T12]|uniref:hypothetical protein n=1 Tax=unclassified Streptomyces TaxID=2593676 RepID=UPI0027D2F732|nr:hypothetical protein [Streptomyces sp. T12]
MSTLAEDLAPLPDASTVVATARIRAAHNGRTTTLPVLSSDGPFHLQGLRPRGGLARVDVIGAMSGPLGGPHPAWDGPAVMGSHRACGQLLVVDPSLAHPPDRPGTPRHRGGRHRHPATTPP